MQEWGEQSEFQQIYSKWPECILASPSLVWTTLHFYSLIGAFTENLFRSQSEFLIYFLVHCTLFHFFLSYVSTQFFFFSFNFPHDHFLAARVRLAPFFSHPQQHVVPTHNYTQISRFLFHSILRSSTPVPPTTPVEFLNSHNYSTLFRLYQNIKKKNAGRSFFGVGREAGRCTMVCL